MRFATPRDNGGIDARDEDDRAQEECADNLHEFYRREGRKDHARKMRKWFLYPGLLLIEVAALVAIYLANHR